MEKLRDIFLIFTACCIFLSCRDEVKSVVDKPTDPETTPTMVTDDVVTLISDSGTTKYRITADVWLMFEEAEKPFWLFPKGLLLEQFDSVFNTEASIRCDSAKYFKDDELWRLDGNVEISNVRKELILTNQLFWSQKRQKVYSDSFVHIEKADRIIEGYGFVSNERMTTYSLNHPSGIFPIDEQRMSARRNADSSATVADSAIAVADTTSVHLQSSKK